jgi:hypothetical protein
MNQRKLLGVRFDAVTRPQALERLLELARKAREDHLPAQLIVTQCSDSCHCASSPSAASACCQRRAAGGGGWCAVGCAKQDFRS